MSLLSSLSRDKKEAVGLLQIGTFLEYFDLMLYVHMAVLLNALFFPKSDPYTENLLAAFAFCSTYLLRPFGALLFGYVGDHIGRKTTIIFTTSMMALSCLVMANLPTYAEIGITAAWVVTICRMIQGLSSMGEIASAEVYLTEITNRPFQYPIVGLLSVSASLGPFFALAVASLVTTHGLNWRIAFWVGALISIVGTLARTRLRETPEFTNMKKRMEKVIAEDMEDPSPENVAQAMKKLKPVWGEKVNKKTFFSSFLMAFGWPVFFYFVYIHGASILKNQFGYTPEEVIHHNFIISIFQVLGFVVAVNLSKYIFPLKIIKVRAYLLMSLAIILPFLINYVITTPTQLLALQCLCIFLPLAEAPAMPVILTHYPVYRRLTCNTLSFALARLCGYLVTSFAIVYLTETWGSYGLWIIMIPTCLAFLWAVRHFEKLEEHVAKLEAMPTIAQMVSERYEAAQKQKYNLT